MQRLFSSEGKTAPEALKMWAEMSRREFYSGELGANPRDLTGVVFEKALQQPISLTHLLSPLGASDVTLAYMDHPFGADPSWAVAAPPPTE